MDIQTALNGFSTAALIGALIFAALQVRAANRARSEQAAITIVTTAQSDAWTRALNLLVQLPEGATIEQIDAAGPDVVKAIEEIGIRVETIGYMVFRRIVTLDMVDELIGGVIVVWWLRIEAFAERDRARTSNPKSYEWVQWLAERLMERRGAAGSSPAYEKHADWS
jgi:hypothetical protein